MYFFFFFLLHGITVLQICVCSFLVFSFTEENWMLIEAIHGAAGSPEHTGLDELTKFRLGLGSVFCRKEVSLRRIQSHVFSPRLLRTPWGHSNWIREFHVSNPHLSHSPYKRLTPPPIYITLCWLQIAFTHILPSKELQGDWLHSTSEVSPFAKPPSLFSLCCIGSGLPSDHMNLCNGHLIHSFYSLSRGQ